MIRMMALSFKEGTPDLVLSEIKTCLMELQKRVPGPHSLSFFSLSSVSLCAHCCCTGMIRCSFLEHMLAYDGVDEYSGGYTHVMIAAFASTDALKAFGGHEDYADVMSRLIEPNLDGMFALGLRCVFVCLCFVLVDCCWCV